MSAQPVGTLQAKSLLFNSGYLTLGGLQIGTVKNININIQFSEKDSYTLNSIKTQALRRSHFKVSGSFEIESGLQREITKTTFSSSSSGTGEITYSVLDGQQTSETMLVTAYDNDDTSKYYQWVFTGAMFTTNDTTLGAENFGMVKNNFIALDVTLLQANTTAN